MSDWYYAANNEQKGPVNESVIKEDLASGKLSGETLVWKDGMDNWTPANQIPAFAFRQPPAPAASPTAAPVAAGAPVASTKADPAVNNPDSTTPINLKDFVGAPTALEVDPEDADKNKIFGILAYLGILFLVPLLAAKESPFAKYHANQGLTLFLLEVVISVTLMIINTILGVMPGIFSYINLILSLIWLGPLILIILGVINAAAGKCVPLPVIGGVKLLK